MEESNDKLNYWLSVAELLGMKLVHFWDLEIAAFRKGGEQVYVQGWMAQKILEQKNEKEAAQAEIRLLSKAYCNLYTIAVEGRERTPEEELAATNLYIHYSQKKISPPGSGEAGLLADVQASADEDAEFEEWLSRFPTGWVS